MKAIIAPSLLSSDFAYLARDALKILDQGADWLHVDVMDGHFVDNLTLGPPIVKCLRKALDESHKERVFLDCHLMVSDPMKWVRPFAEVGASGLTFHIECFQDAAEAIKLCRLMHSLDLRVGVAIRPDTSIENKILKELLNQSDSLVDMVLVMTVMPGFGGQKFMAECMDKVKYVRETYPKLQNIQVDGGVNMGNIQLCADSGANVIVAGSSIFVAKDPAAVISHFKQVLSASNHH